MQKETNKHQLLIKAPKNDSSTLEDFIAFAQSFRSYHEALKNLCSLLKSSQIVEFQSCKNFNELPNQPDYVECSTMDEKGKVISSKTLTRKQCYYGCPKSDIVKVEVNLQAKITKLEKEIPKLENKKQELEISLEEKKKEKDVWTEEIKNLRKLEEAENWPEQRKELEEKHQKELDRMKQGYEDKLREKDQKILTLENQPNAEHSKPQSQTIEETMVQRETETTIQRKVMQQGKIETEKPSSTEIYEKYARRELFKNKEILCPISSQYVNVRDFCFHECQHIFGCEYYPSLIHGEIPKEAQTREKETTHTEAHTEAQEQKA